MLQVITENIGDMSVIECKGRITCDEAPDLRAAVIAQKRTRMLILDFSEVNAIEGPGVGMLVSLQNWAQQHDIRFKVFNPSYSVRHRLEQASSMHEIEIASSPEVMGLLVQAKYKIAEEANNSAMAA